MTRDELIQHARRCVTKRPNITDRELQAELELFYLSRDGNARTELTKVTLPGWLPVLGAVNNPVDWLMGGTKILKGVAKIVSRKKIDGESVAEVIDGIITIVRKEPVEKSAKKKRTI